MATEAQTAANRQNAQTSTGPRTPEGKARSSQNAIKTGLFSTKNCVRPEEQPEYDRLCAALWDRLRPNDALEEAYATEILRATWRLRRCAMVEASLGESAGWKEQQRANADFYMDNPKARKEGEPAPKIKVGDAMEYDYLLPVQAAVDRARSQAFAVLNRAVAELRRLQSERWLRSETLPVQIEPETLGVADSKQVTDGIRSYANARTLLTSLETGEEINAKLEWLNAPIPGAPPIEVPLPKTERTQPPSSGTPRNALCPCGSGRKHKRCCGATAPAVLTTPAVMAQAA